MSLRLFSTVSFIIKTQKPCINCIHYIEKKITYPDDYYNTKSNIGRCSIFGKQHFVTGEIEYDSALLCRTNEQKCGKNGIFFSESKPKQPNPNK